MRGKGEGGVSRVPKDPSLPLKYWQTSIELPPHNGVRRRKPFRSKDKKIALAKLRAAQIELAKNGDLATRDMSVGDWMEQWFTTIAEKKIRPKTAMAYRSLIDNHINRVLGTTRLHKLTPDDVTRLADDITENKGLSHNTALQAHRILAGALKQAERRGKIGRNVATLVDAPVRPTPAQEALTLTEAIEILRVAKAADPLFSLWTAVLFTGQRQGELLGLEIDRVSDRLDITWQLQRITWRHGCSPECGRKRGSDCRNRKLVAPPNWEHRHLTGGLWLSRPKSKSGVRSIPLVEPLRSVLAEHLAATAHQPNPHNLVWHTEDGRPIDPKDESRLWHALLRAAKVTDVPLHAGRHTTVDLLYEAGVPEDLIPEIVGHSVRSQSRAYKTLGNQKRLTDAMLALSALFTLDGEHSGTPGVSGSSRPALERPADSPEPTS